MGAIRDQANIVFADGPSGSPKEPPKSEIRSLFGLIDGATEGAGTVKATWSELSAIAPTRNGQPGRVTGPDAGTHTDPVVGGTVANAGEYAGSLSPLGWQRVGDILDVNGEIASAITGATAKATLVDADNFGVTDSAASNVLKKHTWANLKTGVWTALGALIAGGTAKATPVDADTIPLSDSADSNKSKKLTWANLKDGVRDAIVNGFENLFDIGKILHRQLPNQSTGVLETNIEFWSTGPIPVVAGEVYSFTPPEISKRYAFYDVSDAFISASNFSGTFTAPAGAAYVIGSNRYTDITPENYVIVEGNLSYPSDPKALAPVAANGQEVVTPERFSHLRSRNLFDANAMTMGVALDVSGVTEANVSFFTTDFIPVMPGRTYSFTPPAIVKRYCFYDDAQAFVTTITSSGSFTVPAGARFVRGCARWDDTPHETFMIAEGDLPAEYQPFAGAQFEVQSNKNQPNGYPGLDEDGLLPPGVFPALAASPLVGKTIAAIGDSITYGFIPRNAPGYPGQLNSYLILMGEALLAASTLNYGISGSTLGDNGAEPVQNSPMSQRFSAMSDDADLVILMGGTNDVRKGVPLGVMGDTTDLTYYGALDVLAQGLLNKYRYVEGGETRKVVFATPIRLLDDAESDGLDANLPDYCQAVKDVATKYAIPVFDAYNLSGLTPELFRTLEGTEPGYTDDYNPYVTDGVHPTQEGHRILADAFAGFIRGLY